MTSFENLDQDAGMSVSVYFGDELPKTPPVEVDTSTPFRILVLADLGSQAAWGKPKFVDCDDLDGVMKNLGVQAEFNLGENGPRAQVQINSIEDFHPDHLFKNMELFKALREQRTRIANSETFAQEMALSQSAHAEQQKSAADSQPEEPSEDAASSILGAAIDLTQAQQIPLEQQIVAGTVDWEAYVRQLAAPFLVDKADPRQAEMLDNIDATITAAMQQVLHHPRFQQLEATWRGIHFLTDRLDTGRTLQIAVLNVSQEILNDDLVATENLSQSQLYKLLVDQPNIDQEHPWNIVLGDYQFNSTPEDAQAIGRIAKVCSAAGSAFAAGANATIAGCSNFGATPDCDDWNSLEDANKAAWNELRALPAAKSVALALPGILVRRVYGKETDPIDSFVFEELPDGSDHAGYLWMNAAFGLAFLYGETFAEEGWGFQSVNSEKIKRLPIHFYMDQGEECIKACAEAYLVDRSAEKLANLGLSVARSVKNEGEVRFERIKSLSADSPAWSVM